MELPFSPTPLRRLDRISRIGFAPGYVPGRPVDRRNRLMPGQSQPRLNLGPVMSGMQHPPPEHPNPLPLQAAEEGPLLHPP